MVEALCWHGGLGPTTNTVHEVLRCQEVMVTPVKADMDTVHVACMF